MQRRSMHPTLTLIASLALLLAAAPVAAAGPAPAASSLRAAVIKPIDINSASRDELKTLPGIGDAEADRIIANRPYLTKAKLAVDKVLPMATYWGLKGRIVAVQKASPKKKTKSPAKTETPPKAQP